MKYFVALCVALVAVNVVAVPVPLEGDYDPARAPGAFTTNPNYTLARVPAGQAGFASMNGGTWGGNGGATWTVWDAFALRDAVRGNDRRIVIVRGRIDMLQLFTGSPGVRIEIGGFKSVIGSDATATIFGGGLSISRVQQVIIQNLRIHNALSFAPGEQPNGSGGIISQVAGAYSSIDNIGITGSTNVWINHCELADDPWNAASIPENRRRHDGMIDIVLRSNWISISNTILRNHNFVALIGNGDGETGDRGLLKVTYYLNWFQGTDQRNPRVRFGEVHVLNNLYTDIRSYGIGVGFEARVYAERNYFFNTRRAWGWAAAQNALGHLVNNNNWLQNSAFDSGIPSTVTWRPNQYYAYTPMAAVSAETHVRRNAGPR